jgi:hypothetical protein
MGMNIGKGLMALLIQELAKDGLQVKPFSTDPTGAKGYNASGFGQWGKEEEPVELTINGETALYRPSVNVNVNFHKVRTPAAKAAPALNTLTTAALGRVDALVAKYRGE